MERAQVIPIGGVWRAALKKNKKRTSLRAALAVGVTALFTGLCLMLPIWSVSDITVEGNNQVDAQSIIAVSMIEKGSHILKVNPKKAESLIKHLPYVDDAQVKLCFPNKVVITVKESVLSGYVKFAGGYIGIDKNGKAVEASTKSGNAKVPIFTGIKVSNFALGEKISIDENEKFDIILLCINECERSDLTSRISQIDVEDAADIRLTTHGGLYVEIGDKSQLSYKMAMLSQVIEKLGNDTAGKVVLREPGKAVYTVN